MGPVVGAGVRAGCWDRLLRVGTGPVVGAGCWGRLLGPVSGPVVEAPAVEARVWTRIGADAVLKALADVCFVCPFAVGARRWNRSGPTTASTFRSSGKVCSTPPVRWRPTRRSWGTSRG